MSAADHLRALTEEIQARDQAPAEPPARAPRRRREPDAPVRQTFDLLGAEHAAFARWRNDAAVQLEYDRLTTQTVMVAAVRAILEDDRVARAVRMRLED